MCCWISGGCFGSRIYSTCSVVLVTQSLTHFPAGLCVPGRWMMMAQWAASSWAEMVYLILFRCLVVCFEGGISLKYKNILQLEFGEQHG